MDKILKLGGLVLVCVAALCVLDILRGKAKGDIRDNIQKWFDRHTPKQEDEGEE